MAKKKEKKAAEIGKELRAGTLIEGSVRKAGNKIRVTAQLVTTDLPPGYSLVGLGPHRLRGVQAPEQIHAVSGPGVSAPRAGSECPYRGLFPFGRQQLEGAEPGVMLGPVPRAARTARCARACPQRSTNPVRRQQQSQS